MCHTQGLSFPFKYLSFFLISRIEYSLTTGLYIQGAGDAAPDGREKSDAQEKVSPFEEDKNQEMKVGEDSDPVKANGRGLLNGMDRDCKDFK